MTGNLFFLRFWPRSRFVYNEYWVKNHVVHAIKSCTSVSKCTDTIVFGNAVVILYFEK